MATVMDSSSSLSDLGSPADETFFTARESGSGASTPASSPVSPLASTYQPSCALPRELVQHCQIFLEEQLYTSAIQLLSSILGAGTSRPQSLSKAIPIPPASHLALLATVAIHPSCTTRAEKPSIVDGASHAITYLRSVLNMVGPLHADFKSAFQFQQLSRLPGRRRITLSIGPSSDGSDAETERDESRLSGSLANGSSLWSRGQDFWNVLGWAMNCSVLYPNRWRFWLPWLEFMCDVLEADWDARERLDEETARTSDLMDDGKASVAARQDSMILTYLEQKNGPQSNYKNIIKALLAHGDSISSSAFPEVFDKEPRGRKKESSKRKREELDLENDKFGDYLDEDAISSGPSEPPTPQKPRGRKKPQPKRQMSDSNANPDLADSISIRVRLFKLISLAVFTVKPLAEVENLYDDFAKALKLVPLPMFALIVSQRYNVLQPETHISLTKIFFSLLLPGSFKDPAKVDPEGESEGSLTLPMLEQCYAIHAANTVAIDDNARLSLVVENALQLLWSLDQLSYSDSLVRAVEKGVVARETKTKKRAGKSKTVDFEDDLPRDVLNNSSVRIREFLELLERCEEE